jgi:hypothetical protein
VDEVKSSLEVENNRSSECWALEMTLQMKIPPSTGGEVAGYWIEYGVVVNWTLWKGVDLEMEDVHTRSLEELLVWRIFLATTNSNLKHDHRNGFWVTRENVSVSPSQSAMASKVQ